MDRRLPLCAGGCGKYPYPEQWHLWEGHYCRSCWDSRVTHLTRMNELEENHQRRMKQHYDGVRRGELFVIVVFILLSIAAISKYMLGYKC
jgi:hypothetical protein